MRVKRSSYTSHADLVRVGRTNRKKKRRFPKIGKDGKRGEEKREKKRKWHSRGNMRSNPSRLRTLRRNRNHRVAPKNALPYMRFTLEINWPAIDTDRCRASFYQLSTIGYRLSLTPENFSSRDDLERASHDRYRLAEIRVHKMFMQL